MSGPMVVALGGNALLKRGEALSAENQHRNMCNAAHDLAAAIGERPAVIVHGNGPQVGLLALEADAYRAVPPYPLDVLGAETQGMIGYIIAQELRNAHVNRQIVVLLTQTVVDESDPALQRLTKPIGPLYCIEEATTLATENGWTFAPEGNRMRRVVGSPEPLGFVEIDVIKGLVADGVIVVCAGGGGIPVKRLANGGIQGVEAVIDKDLSAALLAEQLGAGVLAILTDVDGVYENWNAPEATLIRHVSVADLATQQFAAGSMAPKVTACSRFATHTGKSACIGALAAARDVMTGLAGTHITA